MRLQLMKFKLIFKLNIEAETIIIHFRICYRPICHIYWFNPFWYTYLRLYYCLCI